MLPSEKNEHMRSPSSSPMKKLSADMSKMVDDIPDPEKKKKKKKKKNKNRDADSSVSAEKRSKIEEDEWLSDEETVVKPSSPKITRAITEKLTSDFKDFDVDAIIARLMSV